VVISICDKAGLLRRDDSHLFWKFESALEVYRQLPFVRWAASWMLLPVCSFWSIHEDWLHAFSLKKLVAGKPRLHILFDQLHTY
jgi:hypothetical protein